ncbi:MAG: efflux transporter outer membrane subunit [Proteobacteria bacterium]|nr:efflux transporter outer membrane subunit [Pseudomonadota bacterium]
MPKSVLMVFCVALVGCSLAPDYQRPAAPVAGQWSALTSPAAEGSVQANAIGWRTYFPDPRLQSLIAAAIEHNRDLRIAAARVAEARAMFGIAHADRLPNIDLVASGTAARTPGDLSLSGRKTTSHRSDVGVSLLSYELDFWGRLKSLDAVAQASYLASEEAKQAVRVALIADVATAYLSLLESNERTLLTRETVRTREQTRQMVSRRRDVGLASDLDYLQADGALELARVESASLERQRSAAINALTLLVGVEPSALPAGRSLSEQGIVANLASGIPSEVLLQRPDVMAAEQRLIAANANIGAARAAFLPRISLTAGVGTASSALSGLFDAGQSVWSFQPTLRLPLFDAGRSAAATDLAEARKNVAVAEYEKAIQQAFREVADLLAANDQLKEQLRAQERSARVQAERLRLTDARHKGGVASYLEVLDAQRDSFAAQQAEIQTRRILLSSAAQLFKALGGGKIDDSAARIVR